MINGKSLVTEMVTHVITPNVDVPYPPLCGQTGNIYFAHIADGPERSTEWCVRCFERRIQFRESQVKSLEKEIGKLKRQLKRLRKNDV